MKTYMCDFCRKALKIKEKVLLISDRQIEVSGNIFTRTLHLNKISPSKGGGYMLPDRHMCPKCRVKIGL